VQSVNLKRALQDELAKSIQMIEGVDYARVHIVSTEQSIFASKGGETSASVVLRLRPGYRLSALNIAAITHLVAGSVKDLKSENVTVIDSEGRLLSGESDQALANGAGTVHAYKERVEDNLENKVEEMLTAVLGPGRAAVNIWATIDMNSTSTVTEKYEPKGVVTKEEIQSGSEGGPVGASAGGGTASPGKTKKDETITTEYEVGKTVKQETILPGKITSLKVAAFVDLSPSNADANEAAGATGAKIMQVSDVQEIIKNALGLTDTSAIKVVDVKFNRPVEALLEEAPANWTRYLAIVRQASLGIMAICALLVLRIFRGAKRKAASQAGSEQLPEAEGAIGLLPGGKPASEPLVLRKQIANALQNNPERVSELFYTWIEEKG
jgi:flagellar M-ring protein FliF